MHSRVMVEKTIVLGNDEKIQKILLHFKEAYQGILSNVKATSNVVVSDHSVLPSDENREQPISVAHKKVIDFIDFFTGIDLTKITVKLPCKKEYFEPTTQILLDEFQDYLIQTLLSEKMDEYYKSELDNKIKNAHILLKELLYRFASEILQYHNELERDGNILIEGLSLFIEKIKNDTVFINKNNGTFKDVKLMKLFETIPQWQRFFSECVIFVKSLNANTEAITHGIASLTVERKSLMVILVAKYLHFSRLNQNLFEKYASKLFDSLKVDLEHVSAISDSNIARNLLKAEQETFNFFLSKESCKNFSIQKWDENKLSVSDFLLINLDENRETLIEMMDKYIQDHVKYDLYLKSFDHTPKVDNLPKDLKVPTLIKCENDKSYYLYGLLEYGGTFGKDKYQIKKLDCSDVCNKINFSLDKIEISNMVNRKIYNIVTLEKLHFRNEEEKYYKKYMELSLGKTYSLIKETNQLIKIFEKMGSLTKAAGWFIFISGMVKLDSFRKVLLQYSNKCSKFISVFSDSENGGFNKSSFKVLRSAMIKNNILNNFNLTCEFQKLDKELANITNPEFLKKLSRYFEMEINDLIKLEGLTKCSIINKEKLKEFSQFGLKIIHNDKTNKTQKYTHKTHAKKLTHNPIDEHDNSRLSISASETKSELSEASDTQTKRHSKKGFIDNIDNEVKDKKYKESFKKKVEGFTPDFCRKKSDATSEKDKFHKNKKETTAAPHTKNEKSYKYPQSTADKNSEPERSNSEILGSMGFFSEQSNDLSDNQPTLFNAIFDMAFQKYEKGDLKISSELFKLIIDREKDTSRLIECLTYKAFCSFSLGEINDAYKDIDMALSKTNSNEQKNDLLYIKSDMLFMSQNYTAASNALNEILTNNSGYKNAEILLNKIQNVSNTNKSTFSI